MWEANFLREPRGGLCSSDGKSHVFFLTFERLWIFRRFGGIVLPSVLTFLGSWAPNGSCRIMWNHGRSGKIKVPGFAWKCLILFSENGWKCLKLDWIVPEAQKAQEARNIHLFSMILGGQHILKSGWHPQRLGLSDFCVTLSFYGSFEGSRKSAFSWQCKYLMCCIFSCPEAPRLRQAITVPRLDL